MSFDTTSLSFYTNIVNLNALILTQIIPLDKFGIYFLRWKNFSSPFEEVFTELDWSRGWNSRVTLGKLTFQYLFCWRELTSGWSPIPLDAHRWESISDLAGVHVDHCAIGAHIRKRNLITLTLLRVDYVVNINRDHRFSNGTNMVRSNLVK